MATPVDGGYRPGLDGIRALAVIAVLGFHLDRLPGGNLGVDAFFVLSGWLITWKLLGEVDRTGTIELRAFWSARVRRLMPAAMAVLCTVAVLWPLIGIEVTTLRHDIVWAAGWASNWGTISNGADYWARFGEPSPVSHFWSLAIEEQFYVIWPLALVVIAGSSRSHRRAIGIASAGASIGSIVLMNVMFDSGSATATYMNTFARAHSLLLGAVAATFTTVLAGGGLRGGRAARRLGPVALVVAMSILLASSEESTWMFRWGFPAFGVATAVLVVAAADGAGGRFLASRPMRWIGDRSYGLYLWHWPIFLLVSPSRLGAEGSAVLVVDVARIAVSVVVADASFRLLETPIRRRRRLPHWQAAAAAALALGTTVALAVVVVPSSHRSPDSFVVALPEPSPDTAPVGDDARSNPLPEESPTDAPRPKVAGPDPRELPRAAAIAVAPTTPATTPATSPATSPPPPLRVLVVGDSTGAQLSEALIAHATTVPDELVVGSAAHSGCGLSAGSDGRRHEFTNTGGRRELIDLSGCARLWDAIPDRVIDERIDVVVVHIGPWDAVDMHLAGGDVVAVDGPRGRALVAESYQRFVDRIRGVGASVLWVRPADTELGWGAIDDPLNDEARWTALRAIIDGLGVAQIDLHGWLTDAGLLGPDGRPDGVHLTPDLNARFASGPVAASLASLRGHGGAFDLDG